MSENKPYGDWRDAWINHNDLHAVALEIHRKSPMGETLQNTFLMAAAQSQAKSDRPSLVDLKVTDLGDGQILTAEYSNLVSANNLRDSLEQSVQKLPTQERDHMAPEVRMWSYKSKPRRVA